MDILENYFNDEKKKKIENYKRLNKFIKKGQVVFVGSSLMEQFPINELTLNEDTKKLIYNRGIGGFTTPELTKVLDVCIFDLEPSKVFINIGTNDMNDPDFDVKILIKNYENIIDEIKNKLPNTKIYVLAYYPVNKDAINNPWMIELLNHRTNERVNDTNIKLQEMTKKKDLIYIDINKNLYDENGALKEEFCIDGIHIYADGYQAILEDILKYVNE